MDNLRVGLRTAADGGFVEWRPVAKDAAEVAEKEEVQRARQHVAVGETYESEYRAVVPGEMRLDARRMITGGRCRRSCLGRGEVYRCWRALRFSAMVKSGAWRRASRRASMASWRRLALARATPKLT